MHCLFCEIVRYDTESRVAVENNDAILIEDAFPITLGHSLVIPRRHVESFFDTNDHEKTALFMLVERAKALLDARYRPDSYNIGINDGPAAGQTVPHLHIHLIPRYADTQSDPRGGIRWIIPDKADYWSKR